MNAVSHAAGTGRTPSIPSTRVLPGALALVVLAIATAHLLVQPVSLAQLVAAGVGLTAALALALVRYEAAVLLGFLLLGFAPVEPAPVDLVFALVMAVGAVTGRFDFSRVPLGILGLIGAFLALSLASTVEVVELGAGLKFVTITFYLALFGIWLAGYVRSPRRVRGVLLGYLTSALASAILGSVALFTALGNRELFIATGDRARALLEDPNVLGPFLVPPALILLEEIVRSPRRRGLNTLMLLVLVLGVLFSYSRAAWLNFAVAVVVMLAVLALRRGGGRRAAIIFTVLLALSASLVAAVALSGSVGFLQERARVQSYDVERFGAQETGIGLAESHPLGIGPGQFEAFAGIATHSTYIRALAEQGILGVVAVGGLMLATLILAARNAALGRDTLGLGSAALLAAWAGLVVNSLFVDTLHWRHMWVVAALVWAGATNSTAPTPAARPGPKSAIG